MIRYGYNKIHWVYLFISYSRLSQSRFSTEFQSDVTEISGHDQEYLSIMHYVQDII